MPPPDRPPSSPGSRARIGLWHLRQRSGHAARELHERLSTQHVFIDPLRDPSRAIIVLGSARSGTTKLAEALASAHTTRFIFEPMNVGNSPYAPPHFAEGQWVAPTDDDPALLDVWTQVLEGRVRSPHTDSRNRSRVATHRVVKCIASNNLGEWMHRHFARTPIVYVHRHPIAVAGSQIDVRERASRQRWSTDTLPEWVDTTGLLTGPLAHLASEVRPVLDRERTHVEDRVFRWCMENYLPLTRPPASGFHTVRFEDLVDAPHEQLRAIGRFAGVDVGRGIRDFDHPSSTDWATGFNERDGSREDRRDGWRARVPTEEVEAGMAIVRVFGLESYCAAA